jgi:hypothetical protein
MPADGGGGYLSRELNLHIVLDETNSIQFYDLATGQRLLTSEERATKAEERAETAEAENARLRAELARLRGE